jgi:hypothetical protein
MAAEDGTGEAAARIASCVSFIRALIDVHRESFQVHDHGLDRTGEARHIVSTSYCHAEEAEKFIGRLGQS